MFFYYARLDPEDLNKVFDHLLSIFSCDVDVKIKVDGDWIRIRFTGTVDKCIQLKKQVRRLARGKPHFTICRHYIG